MFKLNDENIVCLCSLIFLFISNCVFNFCKFQWHPCAKWDKLWEMARSRKDRSWIYVPRLYPKDW